MVRCPDRDALKEHLEEAGISVGIHYPVPLPDLEALSGYDLRETPIPETRRACAEVLTLPIFPEMTAAQQDYVIDAVRRFFD